MSSFYGHYEHFSYHYEPFQIDNCIKLGEQYKDIPINNFVSHLFGLDLGFSNSKTSLVLIEHLEEYDKIIVRFAEELEGHPSPSEIVKKVFKICREKHNTLVYIDGSARSLITELKIAFNENIHYEKAADVTLHNNRIIPVNFVKEHKPLLQNLYSLVSNEYLCIPESMEKVIISLKSAVANEYSLDKTQSSYNDTLDALRIGVKPYRFD